MTRNELRAIGISRFGPGWQLPMARALQIPQSTIARYGAGHRIPEKIAAKIRALECEEAAHDVDQSAE